MNANNLPAVVIASVALATMGYVVYGFAIVCLSLIHSLQTALS